MRQAKKNRQFIRQVTALYATNSNSPISNEYKLNINIIIQFTN